MKRTFSIAGAVAVRRPPPSPPALARPRLFYGWYIVGVCFLAQMMSWGIMFYSLTFFVEPMTQDLGWTVAQFAVIYSLNSVLWGFVVPLFGGFVDRHGVRRLMVIGSLGTGLGLASVAYISDLLVFYLVMGVFVTIMMSLMAGFSAVAVSNWFVEKRGRTLAIMSMGSSVAGLTLAPLSAYLIEAFGWRMVWLVFGAVVVMTVTLPAMLVMKRRPEDIGLFPDNKDHPPELAAGRLAERKVLWTRGQAARTRTFWFLIAGFSLNYLVVGAILIHMAPFLGTKGLNAGQAALGVLLLAMGALAVKPVSGILLERFQPRYVAAGSVWLSALAMIVLVAGQSPIVIYAGIVLYALSFGGSYPIEEMMWASSFGRWTLGRIRSLAFPFTVLLGSAGPVLGGIAYDTTRSYITVFSGFVLVLVASAIVLQFAKPPRPPLVVEPEVVAPPRWRDRVLAALTPHRQRAALPAFAVVIAFAAFLAFFAERSATARHQH